MQRLNTDYPRFRRHGWHGAWLLLVPLILAALGAVVMLLWNWLLPALFAGVNPIGYWQALGLLLLCKILFGGGPGRWHAHHERWHAMTPQERDELRARVRRHWEGERRPGADGKDGGADVSQG